MPTKTTPQGDRPFLSITPLEAVVLAVVILVLVGAACGDASGPMVPASRVKAASEALEIKTAIFAYVTEYGNFPIPAGSVASADGDTLFGPPLRSDPSRIPSAATIAFYQALTGNINDYNGATVATGTNPKNIVYLSLQKNQCDINGVMITPFKTYFSVKIDSNYDNVSNDLPDCVTGKFDASTTDVCAVWCNNDQSFVTPNLRWSYRTVKEHFQQNDRHPDRSRGISCA